MRRASIAATLLMGTILCACAGAAGPNIGPDAGPDAGPAVWASPTHGVSVTRLPPGWSVAGSNETQLRLVKRIETADGLWYEELLALAASRGSYDGVERALADLRGRGFSLVERDRIALARDSAPYWLMHRRAGPEDSAWVAVVLHGGTVLVADLRSTPLDPQAPRELMQLLSGIGLAGAREQAWDLLDRGLAEQALPLFRRLVDADAGDANARYGLALSELALGRPARAASGLTAVAPQLGLADDVRRALGRAELDLGNKDRAAALWTQVLRADPGWEPDVRPWLAAATQDAPAPRSADSDQLVAIAMQFLAFVDAGEEVKAARLQLGFREVLDRALEACSAGRCAARGALLPAYDIERGMTLAMNGLQNGDDDRAHEGNLRIADGLRGIAALDPGAPR